MSILSGSPTHYGGLHKSFGALGRQIQNILSKNFMRTSLMSSWTINYTRTYFNAYVRIYSFF